MSKTDSFSKNMEINSDYNSIDDVLTLLNDLRYRHLREFKKELKTQSPIKFETKDGRKGFIYKMKPSFTKYWITSFGETEEIAVSKCIEKAKLKWPKKEAKANYFVRSAQSLKKIFKKAV